MADLQHTPGPWSIGKRRWITSGDLDIARIHSVSKIGEAEAVANAEFIVRACNSHYDLLETLDILRLDLENNGEIFGTDEARITLMEEAIAQARGDA